MLPWHEFRQEKQLPKDTAAPPGGPQHQLQKSWERPSFPNQPHSAGDKERGTFSLPSHSRSHISTVLDTGAQGWQAHPPRIEQAPALGGPREAAPRVIHGFQGREQSQRALSPHPGCSIPTVPSAPASTTRQDKGGEKRKEAQCHAKSRSPSSSSFHVTSRARNSSVG